METLATVLALDRSAIRSALSLQGVLARSGLLSIDRSSNNYLRDKLDLLSDSFADMILGGDRVFGRMSTAQRRKAWINRTLEQNPVPALWLSNSVGAAPKLTQAAGNS